MRWISMSLLCAAAFQVLNAAELAKSTEPAIVARGPHHRILQTTEQVQTRRGAKIITNQIVEVQGGLHRSTGQGWVETSPGIDISPEGAAVRNLQYGALFSPNLATAGAIDLSLPEGRLQGHILGLALSEGDRFVMISELKDCAGVVAGEQQNELIFVDAFTDFDISVKFIIQRDRVSQNIILHQQLPHPSQWGLTENAVLEVLTEFTVFPEVRREVRPPIAGVQTEQVSFAGMEFVTGRAFSLDNEEKPVLMAKAWERFAGDRSCLVERVPWRSIAPELAKLPPVAQGWRKKADPVLVARNERVLPARREAVAAVKPIQMALQPVGRKQGYLLDWELVASQDFFLWTNGTTFYVSGPITIKTNVFEGGCVIKYAPTNSAQLSVTRKATCLSSNYSPIIMTARDDRSVGAVIGTNTSISGNYAHVALYLDSNSDVSEDIHDIRISHANTAVSLFGVRGHTMRNVQIVRCSTGVAGYYATFEVLNGLFHNVQQAFNGAGTGNTTGIVQHVTFNQCSNLNSGTLDLAMTNSLVVAVSNITAFTGGYNGTNSDPGTALQAVGACSNYLANGSPFRDAGTTNIDTALLKSLKQLTTHPPVVFGIQFLGNTNLTLNPQASRDSDIPDLGWHASPLDFVFGGVYVTNSTITVNAGTAIGLYSPTNAAGNNYYGIVLSDAAKFFCEGSPTNLNRIVRYNTVQEQSGTTWNTPPQAHIASDWGNVVNTPGARFRFTEWSIPAADTFHFYGHYGTDFAAPFTDCQFFGGKFRSERPKVSVTNCLFHRVASALEGIDHEINPYFQSCLFYGGQLEAYADMGGTWAFTNNVFHLTAIGQSGGIGHNYNGYITNSPSNRLTPDAANDVALSAFSYETGALGRFYQPTNSPFLNVGSTNANLLGLYHYTVLTNNLKETNFVVDLGFHYVATTNGVPIDGDGDGLGDYFEDKDGDGVVDSNETSFTNADTDGDGVSDYLEWIQGRNPLATNTVADTGNLINLRVFTPLK